MTQRNKLNEMLYVLDIFKFSPYMTFQKQIQISSKFSQIASLIFISFTIFIFALQVSSILNYSNYTQTQGKSLDIQKPFYVSANQSMIAISFMSEKDLENFYKYFMIYYAIIHAGEDQRIQQLGLFERCNKSHFQQINDDEYRINNLNMALCLPLDFSAKIQNNNKVQDLVQVSIQPCIQKYNHKCLINNTNFEEIVNQQETLLVNLNYVTIQFNPSDHLNPIHKEISYSALGLSLKQNYKYNRRLGIEKYQFEADKSHWSPLHESIDKKQGSFINSDIFKDTLIYRNEKDRRETLLDLYLLNRNIENKYKITYQNLSNLFVSVFGNIKLILMILEGVCLYINNQIYLIQIGEKIFKSEFKITYSQYFNGLNLNYYFTNQQQQKIYKFLDVLNIVAQFQKNKLYKNILFSKKCDFIFKQFIKPETSFNQMIKQCLQYNYKNKKQNYFYQIK